MKSSFSVFAGIMMIILCGCDQKNGSGYGSNSSSSPVSHDSSINNVSASITAPTSERVESITDRLGLPEDYFPTAIGARWVYDVSIPDITNNPPLIHRITVWPLGKRELKQETRGRIFLFKKPEDGRALLTISVASATNREGPLHYPEGYALKIERDDFEIFERGTSLLWAISRAEGYEADLIGLYDPEETSGAPTTGGSWGLYGEEPGYSMRIHFLTTKPGISKGLEGENDSMLFIGPEKYSGVQCLHFRRIVDPAKSDPGDDSKNSGSQILNSGFSEDTWFAKGYGLAKLVQVVNNQVTMTWRLVGAPDVGDAHPNLSKLWDE